MIDKIYVDMDGVLSDFHKRYKEVFNRDPSKTSKKEFHSLFDEFIDGKNFATLDLYPGALDLISYLNSVKISKEILSSTGYESVFEKVSKQKQEWLNNHNINYKANFVPGKRFKYKFATPNSIIIDDTQSVIDDWNKAGGIGILHRDAISTISILKMYIK